MFELTTLVEYTDDALLTELRRVAAAIGKDRLTQKRFLEMSRVHVTTIRNRFGSWKTALDRAGIDETAAPRFKPISRKDLVAALHAYAQEFPGKSPTVEDIANRMGVHHTTLSGKFGAWRSLLLEVGLAPVPLGRRYSDDECFENIVALWTYYGRQPNFAELNQPPSKVGSKAYVRRWGGWRAALGTFIGHMNEPAAVNPDSSAANNEPLGSVASVPSSTPRSISLSLRYQILCRDRFKCVLCGRSPAKDHGIELHIDHIVPWSKGGQNVAENLRTLCFDCNLGKGAKIESA